MNTGDYVLLKLVDGEVQGLIMQSKNPDIISIKLDSGYNMGISKNKIKDAKILRKVGEVSEKVTKEKIEIKIDYKKPTVLFLHTGGTIASKVDYRTGAVSSGFTPEDMIKMFPELDDLVNIKTKLVFQMFSEDMEPEHWIKLAQECIDAKEDKIIIAHGTDTMHYSASAISFLLGNKKSIVFVGAQRSSDRPSSDAFTNLVDAVRFLLTEEKGVYCCMHKDSSDSGSIILLGTKMRKMHTSRRDAFLSINRNPVAIVEQGKVKFIEKQNYVQSDFKIKINRNVAILKSHPGISVDALEFFLKKFDGMILEGTGLGHIPATVLDDVTKHHSKFLELIKKSVKPIFMTSQCINGRVNMDIYSTGIDLQEVGVVPLEDMTSECALAKLMIALGNEKDKKKIVEIMKTNFSGEITERSLPESYDEVKKKSKEK